jgi:hypothetical protein
MRSSSTPGSQRETRPRNPRSRSNTAHSYNERFSQVEEPPMPEPEAPRPAIRSNGRVASSTRVLDTHDEYLTTDMAHRPSFNRSSTFQGPTTIYRENSSSVPRKSSVPADPGMLRNQLRPTNRISTQQGSDVFGDPSDDSTLNSASPDRSYRERSVSPATSHDSVASRSNSYSTYSSSVPTSGYAGIPGSTTPGRKGPPPPPPSRTKKPPPPPPMKRAEFSSGSLYR